MNIVNIFNKKSLIYLFCRGKDGTLKIIKDHNFRPYYYEPNENGKFIGYDGTNLEKIVVNEPSEVRELRSNESFESDILYPKRYIIDKIDQFDKCPIKWAMIDIEVLKSEEAYPDPITAEFPVTSISLYNSKYNKFRTWFIGDYEVEDTDCGSIKEVYLFKDFVEYLKKAKFDLILGWYMEDFDYPYLFTRFSKLPQKNFFGNESKYNNFATAISPIGMVRGGKREFNNFYPAGTSIVDYLTWLKKIYKNEKSYGLDAIMEKYLKRGKKYKDVDFSKVTNIIKERNIDDIQGMIELEQTKFKLIPLYDEIRRFAKVNWEDFGYNSRVIDSLVLQEAKIRNVILPMGRYENEKGQFEGAYRETFEMGDFYNVGKYDLDSCYLNIIKELCLDSGNILLLGTTADNSVTINVTDRKTNEIINTYEVKQNSDALLPNVIKKLLETKIKYKKLKKETNPETEEYKDIELQYEAIKAVILSSWGVLGNEYFRLYDTRISSMITSVARDLLHHLKNKAEENNYKVLYCDTDSIFCVDEGKNISKFLNDSIQEWSKEKFNKNVSIIIEKEGNFEKILILTMCRYKGWLRTKIGLNEEVKGIQVKRKDSTNYIISFQDILIEKVLSKESKEEIIKWIKSEEERLKTLSIEDISFPAKLSRKPEEYKTEVTNKKGKSYVKDVPIFVRALRNTVEITGKTKRVGDNYYWIYIKSDDPKKNVLAFDEKFKNHINVDLIDWNMMIQRNIHNICETIFEAKKWELSGIIPQKVKKQRTIKSKKDINELNLEFLPQPIAINSKHKQNILFGKIG